MKEEHRINTGNRPFPSVSEVGVGDGSAVWGGNSPQPGFPRLTSMNLASLKSSRRTETECYN